MAYCEFCRNLYISSAIKHPARVKWKLKHGAGQLMVYVVARSNVKDGQLDVIHAVNLKQAYYRAHPVYVYGLAQTMRGAMRIVTRIAEEAVVRGYGGELLRYLEDRDERTPHPSPSVTPSPRGEG